ncbi:MAG TPA: glutathione S-transferase N-terminal domain-containing protein [Solimonas sp.]|nr:glutathione S-transferase N-terminal domain-containing protein [Solimonas sp.]
MPNPLDVSVSMLAGTLRGWRGTQAFAPARARPEQLLELYDIEASPYCRLVREVLTELDLDAMIYPCPSGGTRFRPRAQLLGGKQQFPFLVDPNTGARLYESAEIAEYLGKTYQRRVPGTRGVRRRLAVGSSYLVSALRLSPGGVRGMKARASHAPEKPLELFSFESSPYSRPVRERLCELELPYVLRNTGKGQWQDMGPPALRDRVFKADKASGRNRKVLAERTGRVQVPYLMDPNTGTEMYESDAILAYLDRTYGG